MASRQRDIAFEASWRRQQDRQHRPVADSLYRQVFGDNIEVVRIDETEIESATSKALDLLAVDFHLIWPSGDRLSGQEKFLSYDQRKYGTITISEHSRPRCTAQIYFVGYLTAAGDGFDPWIILNWADVVLATARARVAWNMRRSHGNYPSFWWTPIERLPEECIIAQGPSPGAIAHAARARGETVPIEDVVRLERRSGG